jgi:hypothetical protein
MMGWAHRPERPPPLFFFFFFFFFFLERVTTLSLLLFLPGQVPDVYALLFL